MPSQHGCAAEVRGIPDIPALKEGHDRTLIVSGAGELAHALIAEDLVDEFWFWVSPYLWPIGPGSSTTSGPCAWS
jgi:riboflavin biosynthesis pyrimidine reductase